MQKRDICYGRRLSRNKRINVQIEKIHENIISIIQEITVFPFAISIQYSTIIFFAIKLTECNKRDFLFINPK